MKLVMNESQCGKRMINEPPEIKGDSWVRDSVSKVYTIDVSDVVQPGRDMKCIMVASLSKGCGANVIEE